MGFFICFFLFAWGFWVLYLWSPGFATTQSEAVVSLLFLPVTEGGQLIALLIIAVHLPHHTGMQGCPSPACTLPLPIPTALPPGEFTQDGSWAGRAQYRAEIGQLELGTTSTKSRCVTPEPAAGCDSRVHSDIYWNSSFWRATGRIGQAHMFLFEGIKENWPRVIIDNLESGAPEWKAGCRVRSVADTAEGIPNPLAFPSPTQLFSSQRSLKTEPTLAV